MLFSNKNITIILQKRKYIENKKALCYNLKRKQEKRNKNAQKHNH